MTIDQFKNIIINELKLISEITPGEKAKKQGLHHVGFGNFANKSGKVIAKSEDGKLIPINKKPTDYNSEKYMGKRVKQKISDLPMKQAQSIFARDYYKFADKKLYVKTLKDDFQKLGLKPNDEVYTINAGHPLEKKFIKFLNSLPNKMGAYSSFNDDLGHEFEEYNLKNYQIIKVYSRMHKDLSFLIKKKTNN